MLVDPEWVKQKYQEEGVEVKDSDEEWATEFNTLERMKKRKMSRFEGRKELKSMTSILKEMLRRISKFYLHTKGNEGFINFIEMN